MRDHQRRHDLYFAKEAEAKEAFKFFAFYIPNQVTREVYQVSFFTPWPLTMLEQVLVLMKTKPWQAFFNLHDDQNPSHTG